MKKSKSNCYSSKELAFMEWGQNVRQRIMKLLLHICTAYSITANHITLGAFIAGALGALALLYSPWLGIGLICIHVILDGVDGPLARYTNTDSNKGSFADTFSDQIVIALVCFVLIEMDTISAASGLIYILSYIIVVGFAMVRNALNVPYSWLVRPRFFVYLWIPFELFIFNGTMIYVLYAFSFLLCIKVYTGFLSIYKNLS